MKKGSERPQPPTGAKLWALRAFGILFAFFLLGIVEVSLRVLGVAAPEPLVLRKQQGAFDAYQLNPRVGLNYFPSEMERIMPQPGFQLFRAEKPAGTLRVFVLGAGDDAELRSLLKPCAPDLLAAGPGRQRGRGSSQ